MTPPPLLASVPQPRTLKYEAEGHRAAVSQRQKKKLGIEWVPPVHAEHDLDRPKVFWTAQINSLSLLSPDHSLSSSRPSDCTLDG